MQIVTDILGAAFGRVLGDSQAASATRRSASSGGFGGFGPAALLSLATAEPDTDTRPPGLLGSVFNPARPTGRITSIDLSGLISQQRAAPPAPARSPAARKQENDALGRAAALIASSNYEDARRVAGDVLKSNPRSAGAVHTLGTIELSQRNYQQAEAFYRRADYLDPTRGFAADAENARVLRGNDATVLAYARRLLSSADTLPDGIRLLTNLTDRSPELTEARLTLGDALLRRRDAANGLDQYEQALATADSGQLGQLESRLNALLEIAPNAPFVNQLLGRVQLQRGQTEQALLTLGRATRLSNDDITYKAQEARAYAVRGRAQLERGDLTAALSSFGLARDLDPVSDEARGGLSEALTLRGEQRLRAGAARAALDDLRAAAQALGDLGTTEQRERLARGLFKSGANLEAARRAVDGRIGREALAFQAAFDLVPTNQTYRNRLAATRFALGDEFAAEGKRKEAAAAYHKAYDLIPTNATYKAQAIQAYVEYGAERLAALKYDEAVTAYRTAFSIDANDPAARRGLAEAYDARGMNHRTLGRNREAALDLREALRLFPDDETFQAHFELVRAYL